MQITATQGGSTSNGLILRLYVLTGAAAAASQTGSAYGANFTSSLSFTTSFTTTAGSGVYGASSRNRNTVASTGSNMTVVDDVNDATNTTRYITLKTLAVSGGATTRGYTVGTASNGGLALAEILAAGTLAEDLSAPPLASTTAALSTVTDDFTPPGGSLLVAVVSSDGGTGTTTMTVSGGGLSWSERIRNTAAAQMDYSGVWLADVPSGGGPASANAGAAAAVAAGAGAGAVDGTGPLFAGAASGTGWAATSNAVGGTQGDYATWTDSGSGTSATLELSAFGAQTAVPAGATVGDAVVTVRHSEDPADQIVSVTAQCYLSGAAYGTPQPLTVSATVHEDTVTVAGLAWADLADLRVRVTATRA